MDSIAQRLAHDYPRTNKDWGVTVLTLQEYNIRSAGLRNSMTLIMTVVGLVLLIACANIAGLLLARGAGRAHELAIRSAMGASRARLLRQMLAETLLIGVAGGGVGLLVSIWGIQLLRAGFNFNRYGRQVAAGFGMDQPTLLFALVISLLTTIVFGLVPAIRASKASTCDALSETGRTGQSFGRSRLCSVLVTGEVALALVLLTAACVIIREDLREWSEPNGLYVIGTTRHEARRIDNQLRGRAGRQGDPGTSRFFISLEDDLLVRFGIAENPDIDSVQRTAESQNLEIRQTLWKYESAIEHHSREVYALRREILLSPDWSINSLLPEEQFCELVQAAGEDAVETAGRRLALAIIDDLWADYLANVADLRGGIHWVSWGGRDPLYSLLTGTQEIYADFHRYLNEEIAAGFATADIRNGEIRFRNQERFERGATWTYLTTDQPFGTLGDRIMKGLRRRYRRNTR